jgi:MarR family transcriptional regulator, organic hydroperoxide resistance regulator
MDDRKSQLAMEVLGQFRAIYGSAKLHFQQIEKICGISSSQVWLLKEISETPHIGVSQLAIKLSIHQTTCSLLVDKLVKKHLVHKVKDLKDQRRVGLMTTEAGLALLKKAPKPLEGILPKAVNALKINHLTGLNKELNTLITQLEIYDQGMSNQPLADL